MEERCSVSEEPTMLTGTSLPATQITVWGYVNVQGCMCVKKISSVLQYEEEMAQLKAKLNAQVEFRHAIAENPAMYYEQYVLGEISLDEFKVKQQKIRQAAEHQKAIELEIKECEQAYSRFSRLCKVRDKGLPLSMIVSEINKIVVDVGKEIMVQ